MGYERTLVISWIVSVGNPDILFILDLRFSIDLNICWLKEFFENRVWYKMRVRASKENNRSINKHSGLVIKASLRQHNRSKRYSMNRDELHRNRKWLKVSVGQKQLLPEMVQTCQYWYCLNEWFFSKKTLQLPCFCQSVVSFLRFGIICYSTKLTPSSDVRNVCFSFDNTHFVVVVLDSRKFPLLDIMQRY